MLEAVATRLAAEAGRRLAKKAAHEAASRAVPVVLTVGLLGGLGVFVALQPNAEQTANVATLIQRQAKAAPASAAPIAGCLPGGTSGTLKPSIDSKGAQWDATFTAAVAAYPGGLSAPMLKAQAWAESGFNPGARSPVGAQGMIQFMPGTWRAHGVDGDGDGRADIMNPVDNIFSAAKYGQTLRRLVAPFSASGVGTDELVLAAYNAGIGNVSKYRGVPPFKETQSYVRKIPAKAAEYGTLGNVVACAVETSTAVVGDWAAPMKPGTYRLTSGFGPRNTGIAGASRNHMGTDMARPAGMTQEAYIGTPIYAIGAGEVIRAGQASGYGQAVYIRHADGTISRYGHVRYIYVKTGDRVTAGQKIAGVGAEGIGSGPHLHLECRPNDVPVDCVPWLKQRGITL